MAKKAVGLKWVGITEMIIGVPPRDLTPEEAKKHKALIDLTQENTKRVLYIADEPKRVEEEIE